MQCQTLQGWTLSQESHLSTQHTHTHTHLSTHTDTHIDTHTHTHLSTHTHTHPLCPSRLFSLHNTNSLFESIHPSLTLSFIVHPYLMCVCASVTMCVYMSLCVYL